MGISIIEMLGRLTSHVFVYSFVPPSTVIQSSVIFTIISVYQIVKSVGGKEGTKKWMSHAKVAVIGLRSLG